MAEQKKQVQKKQVVAEQKTQLVYMKRYLIIGMSGVGKSTLLNMIYNKNHSSISMTQPAITSNKAASCTKKFMNYFNMRNQMLIIGDSHLPIHVVRNSIKNLLKGAACGFDGIIVVERYGRLSLCVRKNLYLLTKLFGSAWRSNSIFVFTYKHNTSYVKWRQENKDDKEALRLLCDFKDIFFIDNELEDDLESIKGPKRKIRLGNIQVSLNSLNGTILIDRSNYATIIKNAIKYLHEKKVLSNVVNWVVKRLPIVNKKIQTWLGPCAICTDDIYGRYVDDFAVTDCGHLFHHKCIQDWIKHKKSCPICRRSVTKIRLNSVLSFKFFFKPNKTKKELK